jgi:DNA-binding ferritin-like protein
MPDDADNTVMGAPQPVKDPYTGLHAEAVQAIWHDPTTYNLMKHGPPYLPEDTIKVATDKEGADFLTTLMVIVEHIKSDYGPAPMSELAVLLAFLRAESLIFQAHHWQTRGQTYYGDHLLFERLYNEVSGDIDPIAERMVGAGHYILAHPVLHARHVSAIVQSFYEGAGSDPGPNEYAVLSLRAVMNTLVVLKIIYNDLEKSGRLSNGTDNLLQGVSDKHEGFVYLLKQRTKTASYDRRASSEEIGMEFPTQDALNKYLKEHPGADPANHSVKEKAPEEEETKSPHTNPIKKWRHKEFPFGVLDTVAPSVDWRHPIEWHRLGDPNASTKVAVNDPRWK